MDVTASATSRATRVEMPIGVVPQDETGLGQSLQEGHPQEGRPWAQRLSVAKAVSAGAGS